MKTIILIPGVNDFFDELYSAQTKDLLCRIMLSKLKQGQESLVEELFYKIVPAFDGYDTETVLLALAECMNSTMVHLKKD